MRNPARSDDLFFDSLIRSYVEFNARFVRRDWLAEALDAKLSEPGKCFVLLTAEPGAGKSAFMAQLAGDHSDWLRYFIRRDQRKVLADVSDKSLLLRVGYQLVARSPQLFTPEAIRLSVQQKIGDLAAQAEAVGAEVKRLTASPFYQKVFDIEQQVYKAAGKTVGLRVEEFVVDSRLLSAEDLLYLALIQPAKALGRTDPGKRIVILVDALDEIRYHATVENILAWLTNCPDLPKNIRFVLTSRPEGEALSVFRQKQTDRVTELAIPKGDENAQRDVERFVTNLIAEPAIARALLQTERGAHAFAKKATEKAHSNLGYLDALARGIDQAIEGKDGATLDALLSLKALPSDLEGLYAFFLLQIKQQVAGQQAVGKDAFGKTYSTDIWPAVYERVLGVLSVAAEPIDIELIAKLGEIAVDHSWVRPALNRLRQFLDEDEIDGRYRFYHTTVAEFLTADKTRRSSETADLYVRAESIHARIATRYRSGALSWAHVKWDTVDEYGLRHLSSHLSAVRHDPGFRAELYALVCWPLMEYKRVHTGSDRSFARDVVLAFQAAASEIPRNWLQLVRNALLRTTLGSLPSTAISVLPLLAQAASVRGGGPDAARHAEDYVGLIQDPALQDDAYQQISAAVLAKGDLEGAFAAGHRIQVAWRRAVALVPVLDRMSSQIRVDDLVEQALTEFGRGAPDQEGSQGLKALAIALARTGDIERLNRVFAAQFVNEPSKGAALKEAVQVLGTVRKLPTLECVLRWVEPLRHGSNKRNVLVQFLRESILLGQSQTVHYVINSLAAWGVEEETARLIADLAPFVATHGEPALLGGLETLLDRIDTSDVQARLLALRVLARAWADKGDAGKVAELTSQIRTLGDVTDIAQSTFSDLAETLAVAGATHEAKRAIENAVLAAHRTRFQPPFGQVTGRELLDLALILSRGRAADAAVALANLAPTEADRIYVRSDIAATLAESGETDRARVLTSEAKRHVTQVSDLAVKLRLQMEVAGALIEIARATLREEDRVGARDLLNTAVTSLPSLPDALDRARVLTDAAVLFARLDLPEQSNDVASHAMATLNEIGDSGVELVLLSKMVVALPVSGTRPLVDRAKRLVDQVRRQAKQRGNLEQALEALARLGLAKQALEIAVSQEENIRAHLIAILRGTWSKETGLIREIAQRCHKLTKNLPSAVDRALLLEFVARTLVEAKKYGEALRIAQTISHPDLVPQAFAKIARGLARAGHKQRARNVAERALGALTPAHAERIHTTVLCDLAVAYSDLGQDRNAADVIERAESIATTIDAGAHGNAAVSTKELIRVADTLLLIGKPERAADIAQRAIKRVPLNDRVAYSLAPVVRAQVLLGHYDGALKLLNTLPSAAQSSGLSLSSVIQPFLESDRFDEALTLAEGVGIDGEGGYVLDDIAAALSKARHPEENIPIADRILRMVPSLTPPGLKARTLVNVASLFALCGDLQRASTASREALADTPLKRDLVEQVAGILGRIGDKEGLEQALVSATGLEVEEERRRAEIVVAQAFLDAGAVERAVAIARRTVEFREVEGDKNLYAQAQALSAMSNAMADSGEQEYAIALAERALGAAKAIQHYAGHILGEADKDGALAAAARALARTKSADEALSVAERIISPLNRVCILREAAGTLVKANAHRARRVARDARTLALDHEENLIKAYMLCAAADAQAAVRDVRGARTLLLRAREMEPHFENRANKALAWSVIGQAYAAIGDQRSAREAVRAAWDAAHDGPQRWDRIWALLAAASGLTCVGIHKDARVAAEEALELLDGPDRSSGMSDNFDLYPMRYFDSSFSHTAGRLPWRSDVAVLLTAARVLKDAACIDQAKGITGRALAFATAVKKESQQLVASSLVAGTLAAVGQQEKALDIIFTALEVAYRSSRRDVFEVLWSGTAAILAAHKRPGRCELMAILIEILDRWPPRAQTLEKATDQGGSWRAVITAGPPKFEPRL